MASWGTLTTCKNMKKCSFDPLISSVKFCVLRKPPSTFWHEGVLWIGCGRKTVFGGLGRWFVFWFFGCSSGVSSFRLLVLEVRFLEWFTSIQSVSCSMALRGNTPSGQTFFYGNFQGNNIGAQNPILGDNASVGSDQREDTIGWPMALRGNTPSGQTKNFLPSLPSSPPHILLPPMF